MALIPSTSFPRFIVSGSPSVYCPTANAGMPTPSIAGLTLSVWVNGIQGALSMTNNDGPFPGGLQILIQAGGGGPISEVQNSPSVNLSAQNHTGVFTIFNSVNHGADAWFY